MSGANEVRYHYISIDSSTNLSAVTLLIGLDGTTYPVTATYQATAPATAPATAVPTGTTRYWWQILIGPGQTLVPAAGVNTVYGKITDTPEILYPTWPIYI